VHLRHRLVTDDQEPVAPPVDREADLVRRTEPHVAGECLAGGGRGRVPLPDRHAGHRVEAGRREHAQTVAVDPRAEDRAAVDAGVPFERELELLHERDPALVDVFVVRVPLRVGAARPAGHPQPGLST
jgi:hypothetical protein